MATEEKIPSPSDLKKSPVQFTNDEITKLRSLQAKFNNAKGSLPMRLDVDTSAADACMQMGLDLIKDIIREEI